GILEGVPENHYPLREALAPCRPCVVLPVYLQHRRAGHPCREGHLEETQGQRRKDKLLQVRRRVVPEVGVAQWRHPCEEKDQEIDDQNAYPEVWQGHPGDGDDPRNIVRRRILHYRGD